MLRRYKRNGVLKSWDHKMSSSVVMSVKVMEIAVFLMSLPFDTIEKSEKNPLTVLGLPNYKSAWYLRHC